MIARPADLTPTLSDHRDDLVLDIEDLQDKQRHLQEMRDLADLAYLVSLDRLRREERELWDQLQDLDEAMAAEKRTGRIAG